MVFSRASVFSALFAGALPAFAFDMSRQDNLAVYWGQNSYGATHGSDTANWQQKLDFYCQDDTIDTIPLAFVNVFQGAGGLPSLNMANICSPAGDPAFAGTELPDCSFLASQIQTCQSKGKTVTLSLGGATGLSTFSSASQATAFGDTIWNLFLGGSSSTRPFGSAVLDGVDLDIEGGNTMYYDSFINRIRTLAQGSSKKYYVTGAPQCPFPDAYMGTVLNAVAFDAIYIQFYNNACGLPYYSNPNAWDFGTWDNWAKTVAPNKDIKVYIGALAAPSAGGSGYVDATTLSNIAIETRSKYSSFGGIMLWDASQAYANNRFDKTVKDSIRQSGGGSKPTTSSTRASPTTTSKTTTSTSRMTTVRTSSTTAAQTTTSSPAETQTSTSSVVKTTSTSASRSRSRTQPTSTSKITTHTSTSAAPTSTGSSGSGSCAGVPAWSQIVAYNGGQKVTYLGNLYTAKWWSYGGVPGGVGGEWADNGKC
ncbi:hypothetical protein GSI_02176 [Ganoderma sinense ZZ0214-1]|uniref:chitinase n=1 Tax=Ganoderma sinense ZZ0214-1 TaxID=1077348 RepID=A0A2G8SNX4_9APHY|nr:hypothetical protein GSI_02176 [Ganoderma sinense ZZ0214-1]